jgi:hypothetical protein
MKSTISVALLTLLTLPAVASGQEASRPLPDAAASPQTASKPSGDTAAIGERAGGPAQSSGTTDPAPTQPTQARTAGVGLGDKFSYYMTETYLNPSVLTGPAFRAGLRMANPPGKGVTRYPPEWRQGAEAFGRNYGDALTERTSFQTARFATGIITREDQRYIPSSSHNVLARSLHALSFTFVDRSDSGHRMPALSNFVGAAAGGFVGNSYLPAGFNDVTHAGQRATLRFGFAAGGNLFREFAPQMPGPVRNFIMLIAR